MRTAISYDIADLVPHADRMRLLDRVVEGDAESLVAEVTLREDFLFHENGGVGGWVGVELMAQTIGAWAGWQARLRGEPPKVGFLLGTRRYDCSRPTFKTGERLRIEVHRKFWADNGLGQFDCTLGIDGVTVATAALTVFEPQVPGDVMKVGTDE
ncbi:ApeP family dehydratase [Pyxidicoccus xibeiensis]|uniref:ApeP family dehydratase n=1 Tax=Pyxidicoccus xibeiensis TaxID=2906759 RepID=UPI0020A70B01|nr:3-hydroxylacyl-ACP dehydratase [Pyxidicoccus xibeiensis]MCP3140995.1 3-hydroxylacyl-ACP dehydratase [Pyxidicoccus xibeiensis]